MCFSGYLLWSPGIHLALGFNDWYCIFYAVQHAPPPAPAQSGGGGGSLLGGIGSTIAQGMSRLLVLSDLRLLSHVTFSIWVMEQVWTFVLSQCFRHGFWYWKCSGTQGCGCCLGSANHPTWNCGLWGCCRPSSNHKQSCWCWFLQYALQGIPRCEYIFFLLIFELTEVM